MRFSSFGGVAFFALTACTLAACGNDAPTASPGQIAPSSPTEPAPSETPDSWKSVMLVLQSEIPGGGPGEPCAAREFEVRKNGSWRNHCSPHGSQTTGHLTAPELADLDAKITKVLPDIREEKCESTLGINDSEVVLRAGDEDFTIADVNLSHSEGCYRGGIQDAKDVREELAQLQLHYAGSAGAAESPVR